MPTKYKKRHRVNVNAVLWSKALKKAWKLIKKNGKKNISKSRIFKKAWTFIPR